MAHFVERGRVFTDWDGMMAELFEFDAVQIPAVDTNEDPSLRLSPGISAKPPVPIPTKEQKPDQRSKDSASRDACEITITAMVHHQPGSHNVTDKSVSEPDTPRALQANHRSKVDITIDSDSGSEPHGHSMSRYRPLRHLVNGVDGSRTHVNNFKSSRTSLDSDSSSEPRDYTRLRCYSRRTNGSQFSDSSGDLRYNKVTFKHGAIRMMESSFDSEGSDPARFISPESTPSKSCLGVPYLSSSPNFPQALVDPSSDYSSGNLSQTDPLESKCILQLTKKRLKKFNYFDLLPDDVVLRIFSYLTSVELCRCGGVCQRWFGLVWDTSLWSEIRIAGDDVDVDKALKVLTKRLSYETPTFCLTVQTIILSWCSNLSDKGLQYIANRCPELIRLEIQGCAKITNWALFEVVSKCTNLERLNVAGCTNVTCISLTPEASMQSSPLRSKQILLRYLDLTDCLNLEDSGLTIIASHCTQLLFLYLRRCVKVSDIGVQYVANFCTHLREFSICDCRKVTDFGLRELAKLGTSLRYLSVAKCDKISDVGIKYIARYCSKLRYMNARGCEAVSDDSVQYLARCCKRLRSLDIGKCDVTDEGLFCIAEHCGQLRKLSVKSCEGISDQGIMSLACNCPQLEHINIQDCNVTLEAYRAVKRFCKKCMIEHTNPGFY